MTEEKITKEITVNMKVHNFDGLVRDKEQVYEIELPEHTVYLTNIDGNIELTKVNEIEIVTE
jgi:hypothetical protein